MAYLRTVLEVFVFAVVQSEIAEASYVDQKRLGRE